MDTLVAVDQPRRESDSDILLLCLAGTGALFHRVWYAIAEIDEKDTTLMEFFCFLFYCVLSQSWEGLGRVFEVKFSILLHSIYFMPSAELNQM